MLKYILVALAENAVSFCHYQSKKEDGKTISLKDLKDIIKWSFIENAYLQFLYPDNPLPSEYHELIQKVEHADILSSECKDYKLLEKADVIVINSINKIQNILKNDNKSYIFRTTFSELFENENKIKNMYKSACRLNIVISDIHNFNDKVKDTYSHFLDRLIPFVKEQYNSGNYFHTNILTDRIFLDKMNNCNAGHESITFAPNGKFYICPAFYFANEEDTIGSIKEGIKIKGERLYKISNAPICRRCDAYQCRRCIWLNKKFTNELNTPGKEQCVMSHLERNASSKLYPFIKNFVNVSHTISIPEIDYLDPFILANQW